MISVIVPAYNAASTLEMCLRALNHQTIPRDQYEVIVVDDGSTDETVSIAEAAGVRVIRQAHRRGPAAARNTGVAVACGELVLFTDADCEPAPDWIEQLSAPFLDAEVVGAKGVYRTHQREWTARFVQVEYQDKYDRLARQSRIDFVDTYSAAYCRHVFLENGGFDPVFSTASVEDQEFSFRLAQKGYRLVFVPTAVVYHQHDRTIGEYFRRKFGIGYWKALLVRWHPEKMLSDSHTPQALRAQIVLLCLGIMALLAWLVWPLGGWGVLFSAIVFVVTALPFLLKVARWDASLLPIVLPMLVLRAAALGAGLIVGYVHFISHPSPREPALSPLERFVKRTLDVIGALIGLVVTFPIMLILAILIKLDSPGPVLFKQTRIGEHGRPFRMLKLRSMVNDAEARLSEIMPLDQMKSPAFKIKNDPRVTRIGRFLRRTSLDELPQFWNVLVGDMSLVGPRPEEERIVQKYNDWHRKRLAVKPGMTGPMQVNGRGDLSLDERVRLELDYVENYTLWKDIIILIKTIPALISGKGAY
jgi:lipopolysaccharide/colanic/teichoic acid biosynthesis glycosyltransferase/glycosyltransferase involved in cell wall biosynthesis